MSKGKIDGDVRDQELGQEILSLMLAVVSEGSHVRVGRKLVKVDKKPKLRYTRKASQQGKVSASAG